MSAEEAWRRYASVMGLRRPMEWTIEHDAFLAGYQGALRDMDETEDEA